MSGETQEGLLVLFLGGFLSLKSEKRKGEVSFLSLWRRGKKSVSTNSSFFQEYIHRFRGGWGVPSFWGGVFFLGWFVGGWGAFFFWGGFFFLVLGGVGGTSFSSLPFMTREMGPGRSSVTIV